MDEDIKSKEDISWHRKNTRPIYELRYSLDMTYKKIMEFFYGENSDITKRIPKKLHGRFMLIAWLLNSAREKTEELLTTGGIKDD